MISNFVLHRICISHSFEITSRIKSLGLLKWTEHWKTTSNSVQVCFFFLNERYFHSWKRIFFPDIAVFLKLKNKCLIKLQYRRNSFVESLNNFCRTVFHYSSIYEENGTNFHLGILRPLSGLISTWFKTSENSETDQVICIRYKFVGYKKRYLVFNAFNRALLCKCLLVQNY